MRRHLSEAVGSADPAAAARLADCRRRGTVERLPLHTIADRGDAEAFLAAAVAALDGETCGYKIGSTSEEVQRLLKCTGPIHAPVLREHVLASGATFLVPAGLLGVMRVRLRDGAGLSCRWRVRDSSEQLGSAIADCFRRSRSRSTCYGDIPLNEMSSVRLRLNVAVVRGGPIPDLATGGTSRVIGRAVCDGQWRRAEPGRNARASACGAPVAGPGVVDRGRLSPLRVRSSSLAPAPASPRSPPARPSKAASRSCHRCR